VRCCGCGLRGEAIRAIEQPARVDRKTIRRYLAPQGLGLVRDGGEEERDANWAYRAAGGASVDLWELPDTPHTRAVTQHPAEYERRVISFLDDTLLTDAAGLDHIDPR
jgi:hypothetical protein